MKESSRVAIIIGDIRSYENRIKKGITAGVGTGRWSSRMTMILDLGQKSRSPLMTGFNIFEEVAIRISIRSVQPAITHDRESCS